MSSAASTTLPPDQAAREKALDASRSFLVQAPAGSGKTDLLTRRFLRLLAEVNEPGQIVAITFTKAAAAEMRHRILSELEKAETRGHDDISAEPDEFSMPALAWRALQRSRTLGWNLIDLPSQLRISTIDSFCRELALQQPLLSGLGGGLDISENPRDLYRRAARRTLEQIDGESAELRDAIASLLLLRDNGWQEVEELLVKMLAQRDKWMHDFVFIPRPDWNALRERLERSFRRAVKEHLLEVSSLLDLVPHARTEAHELARFACGQSAGKLHRELAELADFPAVLVDTDEQLEEAQGAFACLADLLLTNDGGFRKQLTVNHGFPPGAKAEKLRLLALIQDLRAVPGLDAALSRLRSLPPLRYSDEDWQIVRASFVLLRHAAGQLKVVFAEAGVVDYVEVAQIAQTVLRGEGGFPDDAAQAVADGVQHLLVDEFQDTNRRQHRLVRSLIAAWSQLEEHTCFVVGDPMQSIYSFRDADAELFQRVKEFGLEISGEQTLNFESVGLTANFRSAPRLVEEFNDRFDKIFAVGSGVNFTRAEAARSAKSGMHLVLDEKPLFNLHLDFLPSAKRGDNSAQAEELKLSCENAVAAQVREIVALIESHQAAIAAARAQGGKYRIAVLARARKSLILIAEALRGAAIPFSAIELESLKERPEILDALSLVRALLNPYDRVAWLGVLRAPWCGLSLADLHTLTSADKEELIARAVPDLITERLSLLSNEGRLAVQRVLGAIESAATLRFSQPATSLGTSLQQVWLSLGGDLCVDATAQANIDLLWQCLENLPAGEPDLLGPALDAALENLTALPDPNADSNCGVQLMTIHKAKGLEFEVVIVPDLQSGTGGVNHELLSWLERGLPEPDGSGEATEFLVAPLQAKGVDRSKTRIWVDEVRRQREKQEERRVLYVAATRAREELHLFARPGCKQKDGVWTLQEKQKGLLACVWPAVESEARLQFDRWLAVQNAAEEGSIESLAASAGGDLLRMPAATKPIVLRRLPPDFKVTPKTTASSPAESISGGGSGSLYERHEGGLQSRALGTAVHALLQELALLRETQEWDQARTTLRLLQRRSVAQIRAAGIEPSQANRTAEQAIDIALRAAHEPLGQWILSPHVEAASEVRWAGAVEGALRSVQVDRVFRAGIEPLTAGDDAWWIIDYKTALIDGPDADNALATLREKFAPQIEAYAKILRNLHSKHAAIFCGLYYPRMMKFDWWQM